MATTVPMGTFLRPSSILQAPEKQRIRLVDGTFANVKRFPPNMSTVFVYPRTDNPDIDSEPFRRYQLIRLPEELGGNRDDSSAFRAYSMICVHLWCLWDYKPLVVNTQTGEKEHGAGECPCHGSVYDVRTGVAIAGPAALQTPPNNALPALRLEVDVDGDLSATGLDGIVGYGRRVTQ